MNLRNCKLLERFPEISGAPNLTTLDFSGCSKLTEVHDSVGSLGKLKEMDASG